MTIAKVGTTPAAVVSSGSQTSVTTGSMNSTGADFLVMLIYGQSTLFTPSDSKGNSWTGLTAQVNVALGKVQIFYCVPTSVGSGHTFSASGNAGAIPLIGGCAAMAFSGVKQTSTFDVENGAISGTSATIATGSVTPTESDSLFVFAAPASSTVNISSVSQGTIASNQIGVSGVNYPGGICYLIQSGQSAVNITFTLSSGSGTPAACIAVFKPATAVASRATPRILRQAVNRASTY